MEEEYVQAIKRQQIYETEKARKACVEKYGISALLNTTEATFNETMNRWKCPAFWDNVACWPDTPEYTEASIPCPTYLAGFNKQNNATRKCMTNGTWFVHDEFQTYWANYTKCYESHLPQVLVEVPKQNETKLIEIYFPIVKAISKTGYTVSLCTLIIALAVMLSIKKLHCPRNKLHMHLFISFILRALISLVKDFTFVDGIGLASDFTYENGSSYFIFDRKFNNWGCKFLTSLWEYFITANYSWILMEGMYLHNLIFRALYAESERNILCYILLGWGLPILVIVPWTIARILKENTFCWTTHENFATFSIIKIPTMISVVVNLILFIKISIVLFTKIQSSAKYRNAKRYQKWAKSTLVLAPLFGIHYALLVTMSFSAQHHEVIEVVWLICDQMFASFQGFLVAILYCFLNGEIKSEIKFAAHSFLIRWASASVCNTCFPCREKYLRSARGRASVCTTVSCSSLYNNGVHYYRNSKTQRDIILPNSNCTGNTDVHSYHDISKINGINVQHIVNLKGSYKYTSNGTLNNAEPKIYFQENHARSHSAPDLTEEKIIMLPKHKC